MLRDDRPIGAIVVFRQEVAAVHARRQIALLETFADQAVIAIENARLFAELEARNSELTGRAGAADRDQRGARVIAASTFDLQPVFETLAESAVSLCEAERALHLPFRRAGPARRGQPQRLRRS